MSRNICYYFLEGFNKSNRVRYLTVSAILAALPCLDFFYGQVDVQSMLDCMGGGNGGVPAVTRGYHEGLFRSVQDTFKVML